MLRAFRQRWRRRRGGGGFSARTDRSANVAPASHVRRHDGRALRAGPEAKQRARQNLRHAVGRVALHLSETFGFQRSHALGEAPPRSLDHLSSNLGNQVEHCVGLLLAKLSRTEERDETLAFARAVLDLHTELLQPFYNWIQPVGLVGAWPALARAKSLDDLATTRRLHEVMLHLLIWGEAANLRLLPECLCFLLHLAQPCCRRGRLAAGAAGGSRRKGVMDAPDTGPGHSIFSLESDSAAAAAVAAQRRRPARPVRAARSPCAHSRGRR